MSDGLLLRELFKAVGAPPIALPAVCAALFTVVAVQAPFTGTVWFGWFSARRREGPVPFWIAWAASALLAVGSVLSLLVRLGVWRFPDPRPLDLDLSAAAPWLGLIMLVLMGLSLTFGVSNKQRLFGMRAEDGELLFSKLATTLYVGLCAVLLLLMLAKALGVLDFGAWLR